MFKQYVPVASYALAIIPPRDIVVPLQAHIEALSGLNCVEAIALEIAGGGVHGVRFLARAQSELGRARLGVHLSSALPHGNVKYMDRHEDPAYMAKQPDTTCFTMRLTAEKHLPLASTISAESSHILDPLIAQLRALPPNMSALCQLTITPAPITWSTSTDLAIVVASQSSHVDKGDGPDGFQFGLQITIVSLMTVSIWGVKYARNHAISLPLLVVLVTTLTVVIGLVIARIKRRQPLDPGLLRGRVDSKTETRGYSCQLRLHVTGGTPGERLDTAKSLGSAYQGFTSAVGNQFEPRIDRPRFPYDLTPSKKTNDLLWLSARELGTLWKPPDGETNSPGLYRAGSRHLLPSDPSFHSGLDVGTVRDNVQRPHLHIPINALFGHIVITGATGSGKSTFAQKLIYEALTCTSARAKQIQLIVIDPHSSLVNDILGWYGHVRSEPPAIVRLGDSQRPVGYNPLDVSSGRTDSQIIGGLTIGFSRQWEGTWGSRMEMVFRSSCLTLLKANRTLPPEKQFTLLDINPLLLNEGFLREVLARIDDASLMRYWRDQYLDLSKSLRDQVITPITSKMSRFDDSTMQAILGQPKSTISLSELVNSDKDLFIDSDAYAIGNDTASIIDTLLINAIADAVRERGSADRQTMIVVDEAQHTAAVWDTILTGIRAFGGSIMLITQSSSAFENIKPGLRSHVMGNVSTKIVFRAGEFPEAEYLAKELGAQITPADIQNLETHHGYIKTTDGTRQLPTTSIITTLPPHSDSRMRDALVNQASHTFGTDIDVIRRERQLMSEHFLKTSGTEMVTNVSDTTIDRMDGFEVAGDGHPIVGLSDDASMIRSELLPGSTPSLVTTRSPRRRRRYALVQDGKLPRLSTFDEVNDA